METSQKWINYVRTLLTVEQQVKFDASIGDSSNWPSFSDDPYVNWAVDYSLDPHTGRYDRELYEKELVYLREVR